MATFPLTVEPDQQESLAQLASAQLRSPEVVLREAIDRYLQQQSVDEAFYAEAQTSWEDYNATGLHIKQDEMKAWLERREFEPTTPMPECHL